MRCQDIDIDIKYVLYAISYNAIQNYLQAIIYMVELIGIEPTAYALRTHRSPN